MPIGIPTRATVEFVVGRVSPGARILEIGCGAGHVAVALQRRCYRVTGVEVATAEIELARALGVEVIPARWPEGLFSPVDAIIFTRSLHHIPDLPAAVTRAREVLRDGGTLLVEDFALEAVDSPAIRWFLDVLRSKTARALLVAVPGEMVTRLLGSDHPEEEWKEAHHGLHTASAIAGRIARQFSIHEAGEVAYLYRYLVPVLPQSAAAVKFLEEVLIDETRLGELRQLPLVGRRLVATPKLLDRSCSDAKSAGVVE